MYETDASDLIRFGTQWASLGDVVADQVARVVEDPEGADANPAAIRLAAERLDGMNEEIDCSLAIFLEYYRED